jgi:hypothetical protein
MDGTKPAAVQTAHLARKCRRGKRFCMINGVVVISILVGFVSPVSGLTFAQSRATRRQDGVARGVGFSAVSG